MSWPEELITKVWSKAPKIIGLDPDEWRVDPYGDPIKRDCYGAHRTEVSNQWEIDHINGDPDDNRTRNLQAMTGSNNARCGNRQITGGQPKVDRHMQKNVTFKYNPDTKQVSPICVDDQSQCWLQLVTEWRASRAS